jgi:hypothetical protein
MKYNTPSQTVRLFALLSLFLLPIVSFSQDIRWEKSYGGKNPNYLFDVQPTADYGFILAGSSVSGSTGSKTEENGGDLDYWVWKMDENGEADWQKSFGGPGFDMLQSIHGTNDGGFILAGTSNSPKGLDKRDNNKGGNDYWVIKLNAKGGEQWQKTIGGTGTDDLVCVVPTREGGYLLGGNSSSSPVHTKKGDLFGDKTEICRGSTDYWIVKLDTTGTIKWQKTYGGLYAENLRSLSLTKDGGCIVGGTSNSPASGDKQQGNFGASDFWILKLNDKRGWIRLQIFA